MSTRLGRVVSWAPRGSGEWVQLQLAGGKSVEVLPTAFADLQRLFGARLGEALLEFEVGLFSSHVSKISIVQRPEGWGFPISFEPDLAVNWWPPNETDRSHYAHVAATIEEAPAPNGFAITLQRVRRHAAGMMAATEQAPYHPDATDAREFEMFTTNAAHLAISDSISGVGSVAAPQSEAAAGEQIALELRGASPDAAARWALECAERVVGAYESRYPGDRRARDHIDRGRARMAGLTVDDDPSEQARLKWARRATKHAAAPTAAAACAYLAATFADSAAYHSVRGGSGSARLTAEFTADYAVDVARLASSDPGASLAERRWQMPRLAARLDRSLGAP